MGYREIFNDYIVHAKEFLTRWYDNAARWTLLGYIVLYLAACIIARGPVGPVGFVEFLYYCCHWQAANHG
jgi:hypothetical protein